MTRPTHLLGSVAAQGLKVDLLSGSSSAASSDYETVRGSHVIILLTSVLNI